jgi:hypothetical protein
VGIQSTFLLLRLSWLAFWRLQSSSRWSSGLIANPMTPLILNRDNRQGDGS